MFPSAKHIPPPTIKMYRGNTHTITFDDLKFNGEDKPTVLSGENLLFIVKTPLGTTVLSKTLAGIDGAEIPIKFDLVPEDTVELYSPFKYCYSVDLYQREGDYISFYTLQRGDFILIEPIGTIYDINENNGNGG